jgi:hypothetical protein
MEKVILNASKDQRCKAGVMFGGCKIDGIEYWYVKDKDALLEKSVFGRYQKLKRKVKWNEFLDMVKKDHYDFPSKEIANFKPNIVDGQ